MSKKDIHVSLSSPTKSKCTPSDPSGSGGVRYDLSPYGTKWSRNHFVLSEPNCQ